MRCLLLFLVAAAAATAGPAPAWAAEAKFNVDAEFGWQGCYRPHRWTPVEVRIAHQLKEPFKGRLVLSGRSDELTRMTVHHEFVLTPDVPYEAPLVTKLPFGVSECSLRIEDARGRRRWDRRYELWDMTSMRQPLVSVQPADLLIVASGRIQFGLRHLAEGTYSSGPAMSHHDVYFSSSGPQPDGRENGTVYFRQRIQRRLPADWTAYDGVDLLVLYDADWTALLPRQSQAIADWVTGGGRLLMVLGSRPLPPSHPLAELLPIRIGAARQRSLDRGLLRRWGCGTAADPDVTAWSLTVPDSAFGWVGETHGTGQDLYAYGPVGFGRAGVLAFDPSPLGPNQGRNVAPFWVEHMQKLLIGARRIERGGGGGDSGPSWGFTRDRGTAGTNAVLNHLLDIPELEAISIWYVIGLLVALAVVIGPLDYFVLKKYKRLPLTWLTFSCYIGLFSAAALVGVHWVRHGPTQLRVVTVHDAVSGRRDGWVCRYSGIYASDSDDYPLMGIDPHSWWSPVAPVASRWEDPGQQRGHRQITCAQGDGGSLPVYLPVSIWSMQCLLSESPAGPVPVAAEVEVTPRDGRREQYVTATVHNLGEAAISRGYILFDRGRFVRFEEVPPGEGRRVEGRMTAGRPWTQPPQVEQYHPFGGHQTYRFEPGRAFHATGILKRTDAIEACLKEGAAVVCAEYDDAPLPFRLADPRDRRKPFRERRPRKDQVIDHRRIVRLVVLPVGGG